MSNRIDKCTLDAPVIDLNDYRRQYLLGELVLAQAERDPPFKARLLDLLDRHVTEPDDRALFGLPRKRRSVA